MPEISEKGAEDERTRPCPAWEAAILDILEARRADKRSVRRVLIESGVPPGNVWWLQVKAPDLRLSQVQAIARALRISTARLVRQIERNEA
jgi:hypothetical protein